VAAPICTPPAAAKETHQKCPNCSQPVSLADGDVFVEQTDVSIPGLAGGLSLKRTWNSVWPSTQILYQVGLFGLSWKSNFEERIFVGSDTYIKYMRGDGSFWSFGATGIMTQWKLVAPANQPLTLAQGSSYWNLTFQNGEQRHFDLTTGLLTAVVDRNGNTTQLTYDSSNRLATVADAAGRHLYFSYGSPSSYLVTGVSSDVGLALSYSYDGQGRLTQVTKPDLTTINYTYNSQSLITSVTDSQGKILESHTYDSNGRAVTSSRANGVEAVSFSY
jgi:YD repeat-containing protein